MITVIFSSTECFVHYFRFYKILVTGHRLGCSLRIWQDFFPGILAGFWVRIRVFFQNPARKINPVGQKYEIPAEKNSCRDILVIPAGFSCRAAGKNGPARFIRNGLTAAEDIFETQHTHVFCTYVMRHTSALYATSRMLCLL